MALCVLKPGKDLPLRRGHPWVYSGAVEKLDAAPGDIVDVLDHRGRFIARGYCNPNSNIAVRVLTWKREEIDRSFLRRRLLGAIALRRHLQGRTNAVRLVHSEGDLLPGLIVDRYGDYLSVQVHTAGVERMRGIVMDLLVELLAPKGIYDRSDPQARQKEGLSPSEGLLLGEVPEVVTIEEEGLRFLVNIPEGQKTGFYLDQRENRLLVRRLADGLKVLDCFSYSGGFSVAAATGGAREVMAVDSSAMALEMAERNFRLNDLKTGFQTIKDDAFDFLSRTAGRYDLIILDPPPFARSREDIPQALKGYTTINALALKRLRKGGMLLTCCCTQRVDLEAFKEAVFLAGRRAGKTLQLLGVSRAPLDHPVLSTHPEGEYFKSLLLRSF